ncbi:MAG: trigger factor [Desulfarculaceae bacterium]|nr:trigger factor [Desulfarculaceae bacterium]MCF8072895.1 trigger factor [Desulfarculaceae bacterium]MCF8101063.1 trigger factor [Desulfarculaceae bacterium]MCF8115550.1 trigger factor [Desulfarculaceae bacterium]
MKVNVEQLSQVQRQVTVELPASDVDKALNKIYNQLKSRAKIKGFRPGKAPRAVLERYYGDQAANEAVQELLGGTYHEALQETGLEPVAQPEFDFDPPAMGQDFVYKLIFDVRPDFELAKEAYQGLELKEPKLEASEEELNQRLEQLLERQSVLVPLEEERPAEIGDVVVVDYQAYDGDEVLEGGTAENVDVDLGGGQSQQEIEVALVKAKVGDEVEAAVHYEDDHPNKEMAGKDIRFVMQVKGLKKKVKPELDDDFARSLGGEFESLQALKDRISGDMDEMYGEQRNQELRKQILDQVRELAEFEVPASLVAEETEAMVGDFKQRLQQSGMDPEMAGLDEAKLAEDFKSEAEKKVKAGIILGKITALEEIETSQEDLDAEFEKMSQRTGQPAQALKDIYNKNNAMPSLTARILEEKTLQAIKAGANIKLVDPAELAAKSGEETAEPESDDAS